MSEREMRTTVDRSFLGSTEADLAAERRLREEAERRLTEEKSIHAETSKAAVKWLYEKTDAERQLAEALAALKEVEVAIEQAAQLRKQLAEAREALKWYASCDIAAKAVCEGSSCRMEHDDGDRARFALQLLDRAEGRRDG